MADGGHTNGRAPLGSRTRLSEGSIARYYAGTGAQVAGTNYGTMCERLAVMQYRSRRCRVCKGTPGVRELTGPEMELRWQRLHLLDEEIDKARRILDDDKRLQRLGNLYEERRNLGRSLCDETKCPGCEGTGFTNPTRAHRGKAGDSMFTTVRCGRCRGCGEPQVVVVRGGLHVVAEVARIEPTDASAERLDRCPRCRGATYVVPVTVRETGSSKHGKAPRREGGPDDDATTAAVAPTWVDEDDLVERGRVSRQLDELRRTDPAIASAVDDWNSPEADRWARHRWGRIFVLYASTPSGARLAEMGAKRSSQAHDLQLSPLALIATEREAEERGTSPNPRRRALLDRAALEARALHGRMTAKLSGASAA